MWACGDAAETKSAAVGKRAAREGCEAGIGRAYRGGAVTARLEAATIVAGEGQQQTAQRQRVRVCACVSERVSVYVCVCARECSGSWGAGD